VIRRLIIRPGAIGDAVVSLPAVAHLCRGVEPTIWCPTQNAPIFQHLAPVQSIAATGFDLLEWPAPLIQRLRGFHDIVSWSGANNPAIRERASALGLPFRFLRALPPEGESRHAVDYYLDQAGAPAGAVPSLPVSSRPAGFAVIHPFSGSPRKNWPLAHFQSVAAQLPCPVQWCAGPEEPLPGAVRFETLDQLIPWLAQAAVYLGNDSGISHLAAACGVPVIAVFGPTDPHVWAPRGNVQIARFTDSTEHVTALVRSQLPSE
jgi:ADP-heptose:LPS heptosyltransferase